MGPALVGSGFTSGNFITAVMNGHIGKNSGSHMSCVSCSEVAEAHLQAIKVPEAANQRFMLVNQGVYENDMAAMLHKQFKGDDWPNIHDGTCWDGKLPEKNWDHSRSEKVLGIKFEPDFSKILIGMVESMIKTGAIQKPKL